VMSERSLAGWRERQQPRQLPARQPPRVPTQRLYWTMR
jgi:hypothetical protein